MIISNIISRLKPCATLKTSKLKYIQLKFGTMANQRVIVPINQMKDFMIRCMKSVGTDLKHAEALADTLIDGDYRGHYSHGLNRLEMYVLDVKTKSCQASGTPKIIKETIATGYVDGCNLLGPVVGNFCMNLAIHKAKASGIGMVVAKGSNHFGIAGWYSMMAAKQGLVGLSFTNTSPLVSPTRGKQGMLGTNPLSFAAPAVNDSFVLDMANSCVALGKVEMQLRKEEPIPPGWGIDKQGKVTEDPAQVMEGGCLLPLGGEENTSGYKGYGLLMMVEILCGIMAGSPYGPNIRNWMVREKPADLGQCFIAIDPAAFAPGFEDRLSEMLDTFRNQEPVERSKPILVAGDPERQHMAQCDVQGGIDYHPNQIIFVMDLASKLGIIPPQCLQ